MTSLEKPVSRVTRGAYSVLFARPQQIVATFLPGDLLEFRAKGGRHRWTLPIDTAFRSAVRIAEAARQKEKKARRRLASRGKL